MTAYYNEIDPYAAQWLRNLIEQCEPKVVFGEQVEAAIRYGWLDLVQADMEGIDYAFAATGIPAASIGAPHIRQRLFFVADASGARLEKRPRYSGEQSSERRGRDAYAGSGAPSRLEHAGGVGWERRQKATPGHINDRPAPDWSQSEHGIGIPSAHRVSEHATGPVNGFWRNADWLLCRDGKWRPVEPGTFPLAHGATSRVGRLRAYGNAICAQAAQTFVEAYMECRP